MNEKMILYRAGTTYGDVFFNLEKNFIHYIHENDGTWRNEYFSRIISFFNGEITWWPHKLPEQVVQYIYQYDDYEIRED